MSRLYRGRKLLQKMLKHYAQESGVLKDEEAEHAPADLEEYRRRKAQS
ncbi:MAG: hypothetical protein QM765_02465 [Myxococcales bacterium]